VTQRCFAIETICATFNRQAKVLNPMKQRRSLPDIRRSRHAEQYLVNRARSAIRHPLFYLPRTSLALLLFDVNIDVTSRDLSPPPDMARAENCTPFRSRSRLLDKKIIRTDRKLKFKRKEEKNRDMRRRGRKEEAISSDDIGS